MRLALVSIFALFSSMVTSSNAAVSGYKFQELRELTPKDSTTGYGDRIRRTMHLLSTSTKERPSKVRILFYGQSITRQNYSRKIIEAKLRAEYPHAQLEVLNPAIGGYQSPKSVHTMFHTLIPEQPDLVVFHVYGGESDGSYEQIIRNVRTYTTAELIVATHHLGNYGEARDRQKDAASRLRRELAEKHGSELVEIRGNWRRYLKQHALKATDLLRDSVHHNTHGGELWGALQARHFEVQPADPQNWQSRITRIDLRQSREGKLGRVVFKPKQWIQSENGLRSTENGSPLRIEFEGTRVDVISRSGNGQADIRIDGKRPTAIPETWSATLPSSTPIDYRPAIMRIGLPGLPVAETWTLTVNPLSKDGRNCDYALQGSKSGFQGNGSHTDVFRSADGIIELNPKMFTFSDAIRIKKKPIPTPFKVTWKTYNRSLDEWECRPVDSSNPGGQITLVQQLKNGPHTLEVIPRSGAIEIEQVIIHRPAE